MYDLLIKNGRVLLPDYRFENVNLAVKDGVIQAVVTDEPGADRIVDATGKVVVPGAIDPHTHFGFNNSWEDDFRTETRSAAIGGITTVFSYYRNRNSYSETVPPLIKSAEANSLIDFGLHLGILTREHAENFPHYRRELGINAFKLYTIYSHIVNDFFANDGAEQREVLNLDTGDFMSLFARAARENLDVVFNVHSENMDMCREARKAIEKQENKNLAWFAASRPDIAETESVMTIFYLAKVFGVKAYIVHLSAGSTIEAIATNPYMQGKNLMVETCAQYLAATTDLAAGGLAKVIPPIRSQRDCDLMWEGIEKGIVNTVGSDNAPHTWESKVMDKGFEDIKVGFGSYATTYPLMIDEGYHKRGVPLEKISQVMSTNAAKIFGAYPRKGYLGVGGDADICIIDLEKEQVVKANMLESSQPFTIYEGRKIKGWPVMTISRGEVVMEGGIITGKAGHGRYLRR
jgi:Dihydroorotase and related cyclic amidohydrolases